MKENSFPKKWFFEKIEVPFDDKSTALGLEIKNKLYSGKSVYQKIEVFESFGFGKILVLDGIFQTSEKDEFIYHEMLCHTPIFYFQVKNKKSPQKILIIGGGDGGSLEEVLKHPVKKVLMSEIDGKVIEISKKYLPKISGQAFIDKRAEIFVEDGKKIIKNYKNYFDIIILDLSDPHGPAKELISLEFYKAVKGALKKNGVVSIQSGSLTSQSDLVSLIFKRLKKIFSTVRVHMAAVPLYGVGEFSFTIAADINLSEGMTVSDFKKAAGRLQSKLCYWSPEIHFASAVLPKIFKNFA